jgi:hypothetical protein
MNTSVVTAQTILRSLAESGKITIAKERFLNLGPRDEIPGLFKTDRIAIYSELLKVLEELSGNDNSLIEPCKELRKVIEELRRSL